MDRSAGAVRMYIWRVLGQREREFCWMHLLEVFGRGVTCTWLSCDRLEDTYTWRGVIVPNLRKFEAHFKTERGCTRGSLPRERGVQERRREVEGQEKQDGLGGMEVEGR